MNDAFDDDLRTGVQVLMNDAPSPPEWERVRGAQARLRRRRQLGAGVLAVVAALLLVGLVGRAATKDATVVAGPSESGVHACGPYWVAVHTLVDPGPFLMDSNVDQAAFLVRSGDVADHVAREVGGDAAELAQRVIAVPEHSIGLLALRAMADEPAEARSLADSFAEAVLAAVDDIHRRENDRGRSVLEAHIAQLQSVIAAATGDEERTRELLVDLQTRQIQLEELAEAAARPKLYSQGSSEAFQVTRSQLDELFSLEADWRDPNDC